MAPQCLAKTIPVLLLLLLLSAINSQEVLARSTGPPASEPAYHELVCDRMVPYHAQNDPRPGNGGYLIETDLPLSLNTVTGFTYLAGRTYKVKIVGTEATFRGFLVIAHVPGQNDTLLGSFIPQNSSQQTLSCDELSVNNQSSIGHSNAGPTVDFHTVELIWQAPSQDDGTVDFRYTIVHNFSDFYVYQIASQNTLTKTSSTTISKLTSTQLVSTTTLALTADSFSVNPTSSVPTKFTNLTVAPPTRDPESYRLTFHDPPYCISSQCKVFVGISSNAQNASFLDIYLEGEADGWVAVGFSKTHSMYAADVVACNKDPSTDDIETLDAWNSAIARRATIDQTRDVMKFASSYNDGRISCSVAKRIAPTDNAHDLNLNSLLYVMYGRRKRESGKGVLFSHETGPGEIPKLSNEPLNPLTLSGALDDSFPTSILLQTHGIIMIITWSMLAATGIFFAAWMRQALPKGEWFQVHRAFLLASLFLGVTGFILPFVSNYNRIPHGLIELGPGNPVGTSHFAVGVAVMLLFIVNPVIAAFRCKPNTKHRWIFYTLHGIFIGKLLHMLALINMCLGAFAMFKRISPLLWLCVSYSGIIVVTNCMELVLSKCICRNCRNRVHEELVSRSVMDNRQLLLFSDDDEDKEDEEEELTAFDGSQNDNTNSEVSRNERSQGELTSKSSCLHWILLVVHLVISISLTIAMVTLVVVQH